MESVNFLQVGKTIACGHCDPEKFGEGLKQALKVMPNYKCDCQCHQEVKEQEECGSCKENNYPFCKEITSKFVNTPQEKAEEWWLNNFNSEFVDESGKLKGNHLILKDFIRQLLLKDREDLKKKIEGMKKTSKIPWQALRFGDCPNCEQTINREWVDNECLEIRKEALQDIINLLK